jgi:hypothetical protein
MGDAIKKFLDQSRLKGDIQAMQIEDAWEKIMGKTVARYTDKLHVINDTLYITTHVAPLKQELIFQKEKIIQRVNEALGQRIINKIVVQRSGEGVRMVIFRIKYIHAVLYNLVNQVISRDHSFKIKSIKHW